MSREFDIIALARTTLNDNNESNYRWSDKNLIEKLQEAQRYMCKRIPLLTRDTTLVIVGGQEEYSLPDDCVKVIRAKSYGVDFGYNSDPVVLLSYDEIEEDIPQWETEYSGTVTALVINSLTQHKVRPFPLLNANGTFSIKCRYQALPDNLNYEEDGTTENELEISTMWDYALQQYVIGQAFLDYGDTASKSRAETAMGFFADEFITATKLAKKGFAKRVRTTGYSAKVSSSYSGSTDCNFNRGGR